MTYPRCRGRRGLVLRGVTSMSRPANRTATSPSSHRISMRVMRRTTCAGLTPAGSWLVLRCVRVLVWIRSGSAEAVGR